LTHVADFDTRDFRDLPEFADPLVRFLLESETAGASTRSFDWPGLMLFVEAAFEEGFTSGWAARDRLFGEGKFILPDL